MRKTLQLHNFEISYQYIKFFSAFARISYMLKLHVTREIYFQNVEVTRIRIEISRGVSLVSEKAGVFKSEQFHHDRFDGMLFCISRNGLWNVT